LGDKQKQTRFNIVLWKSYRPKNWSGSRTRWYL